MAKKTKRKIKKATRAVEKNLKKAVRKLSKVKGTVTIGKYTITKK